MYIIYIYHRIYFLFLIIINLNYYEHCLKINKQFLKKLYELKLQKLIFNKKLYL